MSEVLTATSLGELGGLLPSWGRHLRAANLSARTITSYQEAAQQLLGSLAAHGMPTAAALNGDFRVLEGALSAGGCLASERKLTDPANNNAPFPENQIPPSRFDPAAVKLVKNYIPVASDPCGLVLFGQPANNPDDQWIGRIDYARSEKHNIYGRYFLYD